MYTAVWMIRNNNTLLLWNRYVGCSMDPENIMILDRYDLQCSSYCHSIGTAPFCCCCCHSESRAILKYTVFYGRIHSPAAHVKDAEWSKPYSAHKSQPLCSLRRSRQRCRKRNGQSSQRAVFPIICNVLEHLRRREELHCGPSQQRQQQQQQIEEFPSNRSFICATQLWRRLHRKLWLIR